MPYKAAAGRVSPKGVALNLTTTLMFITPILLTTVGLHLWTHLWKANVVALFLTLITPPWGWKKPHPYSDQRHLRSRGTQPGPW